VIHRRFTLAVPDAEAGECLRGDVRLPEGPPPREAVVVVHGFKGFKDWGFFPWTCERLAAEGYAAVSFNFSRCGVGEDDPQAFSELERFARNTFTREQAELDVLLDAVRDGTLLQPRPQRVALLGHSRGGGGAVLAAARRDDVDALVTWAAVARFDRWSDETREAWRRDGRVWILNTRTGQQMPLDVGLLDDFEAHRERLDIASAAARVRVPWLIVHGRDDATVPEEDARILARQASDARLHLIEGAGHTFEARHPFDGVPPALDEAMTVTLRHLDRALGPRS